MIKRFYIVKDNPDMRGRVYPYKVVNYQPLTYGAPIIKYSPVINPMATATIKIISNRNEFTLLVPMPYIRNVVDDIYLNIKNKEDITKPKTTFRIITPTIDSTVSTNFDNMIEIIKLINSKYNNITYQTYEGRKETLSDLLRKLTIMLANRDNSYISL